MLSKLKDYWWEGLDLSDLKQLTENVLQIKENRRDILIASQPELSYDFIKFLGNINP